MQVAVWDTYVTKIDGSVMHFDIIAPDHINDEEKIYTFGKDYLQSKRIENHTLSSKECRFCHIENATEDMVSSIQKKGYFIIEMENCE